MSPYTSSVVYEILNNPSHCAQVLDTLTDMYQSITSGNELDSISTGTIFHNTKLAPYSSDDNEHKLRVVLGTNVTLEMLEKAVVDDEEGSPIGLSLLGHLVYRSKEVYSFDFERTEGVVDSIEEFRLAKGNKNNKIFNAFFKQSSLYFDKVMAMPDIARDIVLCIYALNLSDTIVNDSYAHFVLGEGSDTSNSLFNKIKNEEDLRNFLIQDAIEVQEKMRGMCGFIKESNIDEIKEEEIKVQNEGVNMNNNTNNAQNNNEEVKNMDARFQEAADKIEETCKKVEETTKTEEDPFYKDSRFWTGLGVGAVLTGLGVAAYHYFNDGSEVLESIEEY